jgi:hypothetical protein
MSASAIRDDMGSEELRRRARRERDGRVSPRLIAIANALEGMDQARAARQLAAALDADEAVIDGEVIASDETGRPQFYDLLPGTRTPVYVAFDILWLDVARTCGTCRSESAGATCGVFCRRDRRLFSGRFRLQAGAASSSI